MKTKPKKIFFFLLSPIFLLVLVGNARAAVVQELNVSPCETVRREIKAGTFKEGGGNNGGMICTEFTVKVKNLQEIAKSLNSNTNSYEYSTQYDGLVEKYRDIRELTKRGITESSDANLLTCGQKANDLAAALATNKFQQEKLASPIRESFSTISFKYAASVRYYQSKGYITGKEAEKYYFSDNYAYYDFLPTDNFADYPYGRSYAGDYLCRIHIDKTSKGVTGYEIRQRPTGTAGQTDWQTATQKLLRCSQTETRYSCDHRNVYDYGFNYQTREDGGAWNSACSSQLHKCEDIKLNFSLAAEWFAGFLKTPAGQNIIPLYDDLISPPTEIKTCTDQENCLSGTAEKQLTDNTWGKGVQKISSNFIDFTQKSLKGNDSSLKCADGNCISYVSGKVPVVASVQSSVYYGQCRGFDQTINLSSATIPETAAKTDLEIVNRPPVVTVSLSKDNINLNEEVEAICDIIDPDDCVDKIAKVKWQCFNEKNESVSCFFAKTGDFKEGQYTEEIPSASQTNPYRSTVKFKASKLGRYAITCEAWDTDAKASSSGIGLKGVNVCENCSGVVPAEASFCAVVMDDEKNQARTACGEKANFDFEAYYSSTIKPSKYLWKCSSSDSNFVSGNSSRQKCEYAEGSYIPALTILDESGKEHKCLTNIDVKVTTENTCKVKLKRANSTDEFSTSLKTKRGEKIEAKVENECLNKGEIKWVKTGSSSESNSLFSYSSAGNYSVGASFEGGEGTVICAPGQVEINDGFNIGT